MARETRESSFDELARNAFSLWEGFAAFCDESVGVPAEDVS
jgi:hypothetical protein